MSPQDLTPRRRTGRPPTLTEQARRTQFINATIELVALHGYAGTSLSRM
jgi:TetR/AcrR family transcriptional regulator